MDRCRAIFIYWIGVLQLLSNKNATADNSALSLFIFTAIHGFIRIVLSVEKVMQMRENGKHNNFGFNTWLEILTREHLPPKLRPFKARTAT